MSQAVRSAPAPPVSGDLGVFAAGHGLRPVGRRLSLPAYVRELVRRRHFMFELARSRFIARNQEERLGLLWNVLRPAIQAAVYGVVFGVLFPSSIRPHNWTAFIVSGVFVFSFTSQAITNGARAITGNLALVRAIHFPRAVLPISVTLIELFAQVPVLAVLLVIVGATGEPVALSWLFVLPALVLQYAFNLGITFIAARITTHVRDFAQLLPFVFRMLFYLSGVFYEIERFKSHPLVFHILQANPIHAYIAMVREAVLGDRAPSLATWLFGAGWAAGALAIGFLFFWQAEERYGRE